MNYDEPLSRLMRNEASPEEEQAFGEQLLDNKDLQEEVVMAWMLKQGAEEAATPKRSLWKPVSAAASVAAAFVLGWLSAGTVSESSDIQIAVTPATVPSVSRGIGAPTIAPIVQSTAAGTAVVLPTGRCKDVRSVEVSGAHSASWRGQAETRMVVLSIPARIKGVVDAVISFGSDGCEPATHSFEVGTKDEMDDGDIGKGS